MKEKIAVLLLNLGGPDSPEAVRPFLYNLFSDPAIIRYPWPFRQFIAWLISTFRTPKAQKIYAKIGGKSPLLEKYPSPSHRVAENLTANHARATDRGICGYALLASFDGKSGTRR